MGSQVAELDRVLMRALVEVMIVANGDGVDGEVAGKLREPVSALLRQLRSEDRQTLIELIAQCVVEEDDDFRKMVALDLPGVYGSAGPGSGRWHGLAEALSWGTACLVPGRGAYRQVECRAAKSAWAFSTASG